MNTVYAIVLIALLAGAAVASTVRRARKGSSCCGDKVRRVPKLAPADPDLRNYPYKTVLAVSGMTCQNCARRVENALNALTDTLARVDLNQARAEVYTKAPPRENILRQAVSVAGCTVDSVTVQETKRG